MPLNDLGHLVALGPCLLQSRLEVAEDVEEAIPAPHPGHARRVGSSARSRGGELRRRYVHGGLQDGGQSLAGRRGFGGAYDLLFPFFLLDLGADELLHEVRIGFMALGADEFENIFVAAKNKALESFGGILSI